MIFKARTDKLTVDDDINDIIRPLTNLILEVRRVIPKRHVRNRAIALETRGEALERLVNNVYSKMRTESKTAIRTFVYLTFV